MYWALRQRLQQIAPARVSDLHLRASRWYKQHGLFTEAVSTMLATPPSPPDMFVEPLTAREYDVLHLLLNGASNRDIAFDLVLSINTVKKHVLILICVLVCNLADHQYGWTEP